MAIAYLRASQDRSDKQAASVPDQKKWAIQESKRSGKKITKWFIEKQKASVPYIRPIFNEMIKYLDKNPDDVFSWDLSRLSRNPEEEGIVKGRLQRNIIKSIIAKDRVYLPKDNALIASVEFGMANQYTRDLSVNVIRGMESKAGEGGYVFMAPLGYWNDKNTKNLKIDEEKAPYIKEMFKLRSEGLTELEIQKRLYKMGLRSKNGMKVNRSSINTYLRNAVYMGMTRFRDGWQPGTHDPIVSKELFYKVKMVNEKSTIIHKTKHQFTFRGLFSCVECGGAITAEKQKDFVYYRCTKKKGKCTQKYIREDRLEENILGYFNQLQMPADLAARLDERASVVLDENLKDVEKIKDFFDLKIKNIEVKLLNLKEMRLGGELDKDEYLNDKQQLIDQKAQLEIARDEQLENSDVGLEEFLDWLERMKTLGTWAKGIDREEWRKIFNKFGSNFELENGKPLIKQKNEILNAIEKYTFANGTPDERIVELLEVIFRNFHLVRQLLEISKSST